MHTFVSGPSSQRLVNLGVHHSLQVLVDYWICGVIVVIVSPHAVHSLLRLGLSKLVYILGFFSLCNYAIVSYLV